MKFGTRGGDRKTRTNPKISRCSGLSQAWTPCLAVLAALLIPVARTEQPSLLQFQEAGMGTRFTIQVYTHQAERLPLIITSAWDRLQTLNRIFSDYDPESELMRFCRQPPGKRTPLSPELHEILSTAQEIHALTGGAFDVTIGPQKRLWRQSIRDGRLPSPSQLAQAKALIGMDKLTLFPDGSASLSVADMRLDLGGLAKGYAARDLLRLLTGAGFPQSLVAASGDIAAGAAPPGETGWRIGLLSAAETIILPPHSAISTSGDSAQFAEIDGKRYSHILDPRTGLGLTHQITVSVRGPDPVWTDALATAVSVPGSSESLPLDLRDTYRFSFFNP